MCSYTEEQHTGLIVICGWMRRSSLWDYQFNRLILYDQHTAHPRQKGILFRDNCQLLCENRISLYIKFIFWTDFINGLEV